MELSTLQSLISGLPNTLLDELVIKLRLDSEINLGNSSNSEISANLIAYLNRRNQISFLAQAITELAPGLLTYSSAEEILTKRNELAERITKELGATKVNSLAERYTFRKYIPRNTSGNLIPYLVCHLAIVLEKEQELS